jgi:hypothetical protein
MKKLIPSLIICLLFSITTARGQILSTANRPSQVYPGGGIPEGPSVYGVFAGRTPCHEFMRALKLADRAACAKRKMGITLYHDPVTHQPTTYETRGMDKWSGKGKWHIIQGTPADPKATVFKLELDAHTSLFLLKGDDNVLFILDSNKNFLVGNAQSSYTMNRARN